MNYPSILATVCAVVLAAPINLFAAEQLTEEDQKDLSTLYQSFHADTKVGKQSNYPKFFDSESLKNFMKVHQEFIAGMLNYMTEEQLNGLMTFTPDAKTVLAESDPVKYFSSIEPASGMTAMAGMANVVNKVVGVTGDSSRAFIVVEGYMDGELGKTEPFYSVWPAIKTDKGWRLDVTSNLVRELRIKVKNLDQQMNPSGR